MSSSLPGQEQDPTTKQTAPIYVLAGEAGRSLLAGEVSSPRYLAYGYGLEDDEPISEEPETWEKEWDGLAAAQDEVRRVTADLRQVANYARMIFGLAKAEEEGRTRARRDPLSGLPNRLAFYDQLEMAVSWMAGKRCGEAILPDGTRRPAEMPRGFAVGKIDIDRFKDVNDTLLHKTGDIVIEMLGDCLRGVMRLSSAEEEQDGADTSRGEEKRSESQEHYPDWDFIARVGGDEFNVIEYVHEIPAGEDGEGGVSITEALQAAQLRIEQAVAIKIDEINDFLQAECKRQGKPPVPKIKASFGWRIYQDGDNEAIIERETDIALYDNKDGGKRTDAAEDRSHLTKGERTRVGNIIEILKRPELEPRYRRTRKELEQLLGLAA